MERKHNFSAGPAVLPASVVRQAQDDLWDFRGSGIGVAECSHRSSLFDDVVVSAQARLARLLRLDDDQAVLFLQGGARSQFHMWPMNAASQPGTRAAYLNTGHWAHLAVKEAQRFVTVDEVFSGRDDNYVRLPEPGEWGTLAAGTRYLHYTSNNTIFGTAFSYVPTVNEPGTWLACDMSSDILSRPVAGSAFDFIYAGAQKNLGPSGVTVVVVRKSILEQLSSDLPTMLRYDKQVEKNSMLNTPCTFGIYVVDQVCRWIEDEHGGIDGMGRHNKAQADRLYAEIDRTSFWRGTAHVPSRSWMNVTFTTGDADLDARFHQAADGEGLSGLKGHRSVGGLRASIYNSQTDAAVDALIAFMKHFEASCG